MTAQEALKRLKGSENDKRELFSDLIQAATNGELEEWGVAMLETLKKELFPEKKVVEMSASMKGVGGARL